MIELTARELLIDHLIATMLPDEIIKIREIVSASITQELEETEARILGSRNDESTLQYKKKYDELNKLLRSDMLTINLDKLDFMITDRPVSTQVRLYLEG